MLRHIWICLRNTSCITWHGTAHDPEGQFFDPQGTSYICKFVRLLRGPSGILPLTSSLLFTTLLLACRKSTCRHSSSNAFLHCRHVPIRHPMIQLSCSTPFEMQPYPSWLVFKSQYLQPCDKTLFKFGGCIAQMETSHISNGLLRSPSTLGGPQPVSSCLSNPRECAACRSCWQQRVCGHAFFHTRSWGRIPTHDVGRYRWDTPAA